MKSSIQETMDSLDALASFETPLLKDTIMGTQYAMLNLLLKQQVDDAVTIGTLMSLLKDFCQESPRKEHATIEVAIFDEIINEMKEKRTELKQAIDELNKEYI